MSTGASTTTTTKHTHSEAKASGQWILKRKSPECVYLFGYDPAWGQSSNTLAVANNVKMKMSVIFGVLHMTIGIIMKGMNAIHFRQRAVLWTEVVAGIVILLGLFGWMDILIFAKWLLPNDIDNQQTRAEWAFNFFWTEPLKNGKESPMKAYSLEEYEKLSK